MTIGVKTIPKRPTGVLSESVDSSIIPIHIYSIDLTVAYRHDSIAHMRQNAIFTGKQITMSEVTQQVGQLIREARKLKGMTQKELGEKLGVSKVSVTKYESGQNLTIDTLSKIAQALETSLNNLTRGL